MDFQGNWLGDGELIVDLFAGGGGASQGIFEATGRHPDVAINHDPTAISVHTANHPEASHYCASVWKVDPRDVLPERPIGLLWASPDCRHFSRAAGGRPKWKSVRSLPGVVLTWATRRKPRMIVVENVREMLDWGPLLDDGTPCPKRVGRSFKIWAGRLRGLGYTVEWRELCAADFGAPTIRTRLVVVARLASKRIIWPQPTHSRRPSMFERPWVPAADCIDWSIPCQSIFDRKKPLADATLRRIAEGVRRYVLTSAAPYIVTIDHRSNANGTAPLAAPLGTITAKARHVLVSPTLATLKGTSTAADIEKPLGTICAGAQHHALVAATMVQTGYGERAGQSPRCLDIQRPLGTIVAQGGKHALVAAFMAQHNGGAVGRTLRAPVSALTTTGAQQQLVTAELAAEDEAGAERVAAFLMQYYSTGGQHQPVDRPLGAITTKGRFALVTVAGVDMAITDICMRMLSPAELAAAQGFPGDYQLHKGAAGEAITKTDQVRLIGNSVCPAMASAVIRANLVAPETRRAAA
ncbi:MAG: type restriction endonuclease subunit [Spirosoma sp.]|nr:type restriction endonuclease subunit [Spirosoma sp.]